MGANDTGQPDQGSESDSASPASPQPEAVQAGDGDNKESAAPSQAFLNANMAPPAAQADTGVWQPGGARGMDVSSSGGGAQPENHAASNPTGGSPYAAAAQQLKEQENTECARVALLLGMAAPGADDPGFNAAMAKRYNILPEMVAALPNEVRQKFATENARDAVRCAPVLRTMVAQKPYMANVVGEDVKNTAAVEQALTEAKSAHKPLLSRSGLPNGLSEGEIRATAAHMGLPVDDHPVIGTLESMLNLGTSFITSPLVLAAGALALGAKATSIYPEGSEEAANADPDPAKFMSDVQEALSYSPRTESGQSRAEWLSRILNWPGNKAGHGVADIADHLGASTNVSAALGATTDAVVQTLPAILLGGYARQRNARSAPNRDAEVPNHDAETPNHDTEPPAGGVTSPEAPPETVVKAIKAAAVDAPIINNLTEKLAAPKWRSHPSYPDYVNEAAQQAGLPDINVDTAALRQFVEKNGIEPDTMPEVFERMGQAEKNGEKTTRLPAGPFAQHLSDKSELRPWVTLHSDDMPLAEAKEHLARTRQEADQQAGRMKEDAASQITDKELADQFRRSQDAVEGKILNALDTVNRFPHEDNRIIAKMQTAILSRIAANQGITPDAAYAAYGAKLRGEAPGGVDSAFKQQNEQIARDPNFVREAIRILSQGDPDVFKMPISRRNSLTDTLRDHFDHKGTETHATGDMGVFPAALHPDGTEVHAFRTPDGENFWVTERPDGTVHINVSQLRGNRSGQYIYQAVHDYAVHNDKVFNADPAGLSDESLIRRTTNMLNAIIRHNTAAHILPGVEQFAGNEKLGVPPLKWGRTEVDKFNALAQTFVKTIENNVPDIKDIHYDSAKKGFVFADTGSVVADKEWRILAESREAQGIRAGESSLRRAVFLKSLIHSEGKGQRERERVLGELRLFVGGSAKRAGLGRLFQPAHEPADTPAIDGGAEEPRGSYDPQTRTIALRKSANASTPYHETGHWALDIYTKIADDPAVSPELRADTDAILKWMGVKDLSAWNAMSLEEQRPYHEQFAKGFETYLMEGKAPTPELHPVFARIKALLLEVYKSLKELGVNLSPDIRRVMDRMLGGEGATENAGAARDPAEYSPDASENRQ